MYDLRCKPGLLHDNVLAMHPSSYNDAWTTPAQHSVYLIGGSINGEGSPISAGGPNLTQVLRAQKEEDLVQCSGRQVIDMLASRCNLHGH